MPVSTKPQPSGWAIDEPITQLRNRKTGEVHRLSDTRRRRIGRADKSDIKLDSPGTSRTHAELTWSAGAWHIRNLSGTNPVYRDGDPLNSFTVTPGVEIKLGDVRLVAESPRLLALRAYLARLLGWTKVNESAVDDALVSVRHMATMQKTLVVSCEGDLIPVLRRLHGHAMAGTAPFVVTKAPELAMVGYEQGVGGVLCIDHDAPPDDLDAVVARAARLEREVRIILFAHAPATMKASIVKLQPTASIEIPALAERVHEIDQLVLAFAQDAVVEFGVPTHAFLEFELVWLRKIPYRSLDHIAEVTRKVVAIRNFKLTGAARLFGLSHTTLSKWCKRWGIPAA